MTILGINDEVTTCECCGRTNLKATVVLTHGEGEVHYGRECAARALQTTTKGVDTAVRSARAESAKAKIVADNAEWATYMNWLLGTYGDTRSTLERRKAYREAA